MFLNNIISYVINYKKYKKDLKILFLFIINICINK